MIRSLGLQLLRERRSDTAVEFALIGSVLFLFLFGIMFMALGQFWQMVLDDSVRNAARQVELHNVNTSGEFVSSVCGEFGLGAPNCAALLGFNVQQGAVFTGITGITPSSVATLNNSSGFPPLLASGDAELVQVIYKVPLSLPLLPTGLMTGNGTNYLISAVSFMEQ